MAGDLSSVLEPGEQTLLASGLGRTEGPLWHPEGYLTFVDLGGSRLLRWVRIPLNPWLLRFQRQTFVTPRLETSVRWGVWLGRFCCPIRSVDHKYCWKQ